MLSVFTYLSYNAWLWFANDDDFHATLVTLAITGMYFLFAALTTRNFINISKRLNIAKIDQNPYGDIARSLNIKKNLVMSMLVGNLLFCVSQIIRFGIVNLIENEITEVRGQAILQGFDFLWVLIILVVCRPRSDWPQYFDQSIEELGETG